MFANWRPQLSHHPLRPGRTGVLGTARATRIGLGETTAACKGSRDCDVFCFRLQLPTKATHSCSSVCGDMQINRYVDEMTAFSNLPDSLA
jgi:hypothetical protein